MFASSEPLFRGPDIPSVLISDDSGKTLDDIFGKSKAEQRATNAALLKFFPVRPIRNAKADEMTIRKEALRQ